MGTRSGHRELTNLNGRIARAAANPAVLAAGE